MLEGDLKFGTLYVFLKALFTLLLCGQWRGDFIRAVQLGHECLINTLAVWVRMLLKSGDKCLGQNLFGQGLVPGHVKGQRKNAVTVAVINVPLYLLLLLFLRANGGYGSSALGEKSTEFSRHVLSL